VWEKHRAVGFLNSGVMPLRNHEMIYIFGNHKKEKGNKFVYNRQLEKGTPYARTFRKRRITPIYNKTINLPPTCDNEGTRCPLSVMKINQDKEKLHPTQKPIELCEWLIKSYSNEGDLVMDFCMGSGTTIIACINTNRNYIGIEKDEVIFKTAQERINQKLEQHLDE
jgi:site-specific DNA-methyltransferase (adenine-specific)